MTTNSEDSSITRLDIWEGKQPEVEPAEVAPVEESAPAPSAASQPRHPVLGEYVLLRKIGSGGMGRVFKAKHQTMERIVAVKMLPAETMRDPEAVRRFRREVKAAAKLFHPNIVTAFDAREEKGIHYLVMEYVEGHPLSRLVEDHGPLTIEKAADYILQSARGLEYAHSRDVVHRDVKPSNLILTHDGVIKILDMGTARFPGETSGEVNLTQSGIIMGTVNYMSPEQARDSRRVDHRTDIYSLGCTFHYLLTGDSLYQRDNMVQTLLAHAEQPIPKLSEMVRKAPLWLDHVFERLVAKRPEDRFQTMGELIDELERTQSGKDDSSQFSIYPQAPTTTIGEPAEPVAETSTALGIDLGTTTCRVAHSGPRQPPTVVADSQGRTNIPSVVYVDGLNVHVGETPRKSERTPDNKPLPAYAVKRSVGQNFFPEPLADSLYPPEVLIALLLNRMFEDGQRRALGVGQTVVSVPACFDENRRKSIQDAAFIAGIETVDFINEPMAAVLDYANNEELFDDIDSEEDPQSLLIVNIGGGFCDLAMMEIKSTAVAVKAARGDVQLGGDDWDKCLVNYVAEEVVKKGALDPRTDKALAAKLARACEKAKQALSSRRQTRLRFDLKGPVQVTVERDHFEKLSKDLVERVRALIEQTMADVETDFASLDVILLAGGSTRMPMIRDLLSEMSGDQVDIVNLDDLSTVRGAAFYAKQLLAKRTGETPSVQIFDVNTHSLGVVGIDRRTGKECNAILIPRNTHLPVITKRSFKTKRHGQDSVLIQIIQGESLKPQECARVGTCLIEHLPKNQPPGSPVTVEFQYDTNGRLAIYIESPTTGYRATKELTRARGMSNVDLQRWREWLETMVLCSDMM